MSGGYVFGAILAGALTVAALDSLWFAVWVRAFPGRFFYPSIPNPRQGSLTSAPIGIVVHALVASATLAFLSDGAECPGDIRPANTTSPSLDRVANGAVLGFYAFFAFNISIASLYPWTAWDYIPDVAWGTSILALIGYIQSLIVWDGCRAAQ